MQPQRNVLYILLIAILLLAAGCGTSPEEAATQTAEAWTPTPLPTDTPVPTNTPEPTNTSEPTEPSCDDPNQVLDDLREIIPYKEAVVNYSIPYGTRILSIWYVDLTLDMYDFSADAFEGTIMVADNSIQFGSWLVNENPCVAELFDVYNPIVVDSNYNGWFSASISMNFLPLPEGLSNSDQRIEAVFDGMVVSYLREELPPSSGTAPSGACSWPEAQRALDGEFLPLTQGNTSFFFVIDDHGANLWVQVEEPFAAPLLSVILSNSDCMYPALDNLILTVVDGTGGVTFLGRLPKEGIETEDFELFVPFP